MTMDCQINPEAIQLLQESYLRIKPPAAADRMWKRLLTAQERAQLGDLESAYCNLGGTAGIWLKARGTSVERAVIEVARGLGFLDGANATWLLREFGEEEPIETTSYIPRWDHETNQLFFGGKLIRTIRRPNVAVNVITILQAFQESGWPQRIDDPLPGGSDPQRLHDTIKSLNRNLTDIKFGADGTGEGICWGVYTTP